MKIKCPRCQNETEYSSENKYRPFCSERCQMIDLGQWAEGKYTIPVVDHSDLEDEIENEFADEDDSQNASKRRGNDDPSDPLH